MVLGDRRWASAVQRSEEWGPSREEERGIVVIWDDCYPSSWNARTQPRHFSSHFAIHAAGVLEATNRVGRLTQVLRTPPVGAKRLQLRREFAPLRSASPLPQCPDATPAARRRAAAGAAASPSLCSTAAVTLADGLRRQQKHRHQGEHLEDCQVTMAERKGFEPLEAFRLQRFSRPPP